MQISKDVDEQLREFDQLDDVDALNEALALVESMDVDPGARKAEVLAFRGEKLRLLLEVFNHLDPKLIRDFDLEDLPPINTAPPPETGLPAGVDPKSIKDPKARAEYEKEIAANQSRAKVYKFQSKLHAADKAVTNVFEAHVAAHYPKSSEETLRKVIEEGVRSEARKASLKERVSAVFAELR